MPTPGDPWTDVEKTILRMSVQLGLTYEEIAAQKLPNRSVSGIAAMVREICTDLKEASPYSRMGHKRIHASNNGVITRIRTKSRNGVVSGPVPKRPKQRIEPALRDGQRITMETVLHDECHYIESDKEGALEVCGHKTEEGNSWCDFHDRIVHA